jgi:2-desacetyl-2-hydroxyethyl bacteriochlorophyllide A dehydrogenase
MKAAYLLNGDIQVGDVPDPVPVEGRALVRTHRCGLCASDAHFLHMGADVVARSKEFGGPHANLDLDRVIVPGHEFVGEIVDYATGSERRLKIGTRVTSLPVVMTESGYEIIGQSHDLPGGFGEYMLLDENSLMEIPADLDDDLAAMTEPLSVGLEHARAGDPTADDVALVVGCGAIGLGVIAGLKLTGIGPVIAADFDERRRDLAAHMGADVVVDPREVSPYEPMHELGGRTPTLVYECVGAPGMLHQIIQSVGYGARIVVGGFCLEPEQLYVPVAQMKRLRIHFASGEEQPDLDLALQSIADGTVDVRSWLGAEIGLSGVGDALWNMSDPSSPVRTVVDPRHL